MRKLTPVETFDYAIVGSGFGGSVSAMRLAQKGYKVLVLERGKRFADEDFPKTSWNILKYLWAPRLRCFGILQFNLFRSLLVLNSSGVGGGSLGYGGVLMQPDDRLFEHPSWRHLADWKELLSPHYARARQMLGAVRNPRRWPADEVLAAIARDLNSVETPRPTEVGIFFGEPDSEAGQELPDPYFGGQGPPRRTCQHCGGCMVGCRHNGKNTLLKNYLYFAEKWGTEVWPECQVLDVRPLAKDQPDGARYEVVYRRSTSWLLPRRMRIRARNVIIAAGALGTLRLLFHCRDVTGSLAKLSNRLGDRVRSNSEALLGVSSRTRAVNYSKGTAITSIFQADPITAVEPVRFSPGSSLIRLLAGPLVDSGDRVWERFFKAAGHFLHHPVDFFSSLLYPGWAERTTILLVMQTEDNYLRIRLGRDPLTLFRRGLVSFNDGANRIPGKIDIGYKVARAFAAKTDGIPVSTFFESLLNIPVTAHILGGCPMGIDEREGVVGLDCQVHNYPGLFVVDGSIIPANPGVNPALSIAAMAEYAISQVPVKSSPVVALNRLKPVRSSL